MKLFAVLGLALLLPQEKNEAESLFKKLEEKVLKSETVTFAFEMVMTMGKETERKTGSVVIQKGDRVLLEITQGDERVRIVSDGKRIHMDSKDTFLNPTPCAVTAGTSRQLLEALLKWGGFFAVQGVRSELVVIGLEDMSRDDGHTPPPRGPDPAKSMRLTSFKLGPPEKVKGREAQAIQFQMEQQAVDPKGVFAEATLWLDKESMTPLKRRMDIVRGGETASMEETFAEFTFDAKVDAAKFVLPKNEAEALFLAMERKLAAAATVRMKFEHALEMERMTVSGEVLLADGNRWRMEFEGAKHKEPLKALLLSDGRKVHRNPGRDNAKPPFDAPPKLGRYLRLALARAGFFGTQETWSNEKAAAGDPDKDLVATEFKARDKEKVDGRDAQAVDYKLSIKGQEPVTARVWIDVVTHLPLKRRVKLVAMYETYIEFKLDEKIDPAKFELPKDK